MEINGAQGMYTTSPEVGPRPMRCRGGLAGAPTCDSDGDRPLVFDREAAPLHKFKTLLHEMEQIPVL